MTPEEFFGYLERGDSNIRTVTANLQSVMTTMQDSEICLFLYECDTVLEGMDKQIIKEGVRNGVDLRERVRMATWHIARSLDAAKTFL